MLNMFWWIFDVIPSWFPFLNLYDIPVMLVPSTIWAVYSELNKNLVRHEFYHFISITWDSEWFPHLKVWRDFEFWGPWVDNFPRFHCHMSLISVKNRLNIISKSEMHRLIYSITCHVDFSHIKTFQWEICAHKLKSLRCRVKNNKSIAT